MLVTIHSQMYNLFLEPTKKLKKSNKKTDFKCSHLGYLLDLSHQRVIGAPMSLIL